MQPSSSTRATIVSAENQNGATIVKATFFFCHYYIVCESNNAGEARRQSWNESLKSRWLPGGSCGYTSGTKRKHFAALSSPRPCWRWLQLQPSCGSPQCTSSISFWLNYIYFITLGHQIPLLSFIPLRANNQVKKHHHKTRDFRAHTKSQNRWISTNACTVYPKKYAHGFCFAVLCCGYTLTDFPISIRLTSLALWQSNDCPSASKATLINMDKYFMWIHYERLRNHNKAKHNKTVCIFLGIYCNSVWTFTFSRWPWRNLILRQWCIPELGESVITTVFRFSIKLTHCPREIWQQF